VLGLDVAQVDDAGGGTRRAVVSHPLEHEGVMAVVGPRVARPQRLEDDERLAERAGMLDGAIECEVPGGPPEGDHPVEDVIASARSGVIAGARMRTLGTGTLHLWHC
jgi:hypothetical protein